MGTKHTSADQGSHRIAVNGSGHPLTVLATHVLRRLTSKSQLYRATSISLPGRILAYMLLAAATVWSLLPLAWSLAASFTPREDIFQYALPFSWHALVPAHPTLQSYQNVIAGPFPRALANTLFVCAVTVAAGLITNSMAGFAFATFRFRGRHLLFIFVLLTFMIPFEILGLPLYIIVTNLHFDNTFQAIILPFVANGLVVFLFRQFFASVPRDLLDAGRIDGLSWFGVYFRIVVPLTVPVMISGGLILFLSQWESLFWPLLIANSPDHQVVQVVLANFRTQYATNWDQLFSESVVIVFIPTVMLLVLQRYYVRTIATSGLRE